MLSPGQCMTVHWPVDEFCALIPGNMANGNDRQGMRQRQPAAYWSPDL